jgi:hypothetical protein
MSNKEARKRFAELGAIVPESERGFALFQTVLIEQAIDRNTEALKRVCAAIHSPRGESLEARDVGEEEDAIARAQGRGEL